MIPLAVLLISDGKPGHYNLSEAIVAALRRRHAVTVQRAAVSRPRWLPPKAASRLTRIRAGFLPRLFGLDLAAFDRPDVVVSAGGDTLSANALATRYFQCRNVFYGSLRGYSPDDFTLVLTSYPEQTIDRPGTVMTLKPSPRDPDTLRRAGTATGLPRSVAMLVGGDSGTVCWTDKDWDELLAFCASKPDAVPNACLVVANSRRTPGAVSDRLTELATTGAIGFVDVRTSGAGTLGPLLEASDAILATIDSSSMISEAVWMRRPVAVLSPRRAGLPPLEQGYRTWIASHGWTDTIQVAKLDWSAVDQAISTCRPIEGNPLAALSDLLEERLIHVPFRKAESLAR